MLAELIVHDEMVWIKGYEVGIQDLTIRPCGCHRHPPFLVWMGPRLPRGRHQSGSLIELGDAMPDGET